MTPSAIRPWLAALAVASVAAGCDTGPDTLVVARAAGHDLTGAQTVELLAEPADVQNRPEAVEVLADLWIDYILLAEAMAEDSTLSHVDVSPLVGQQVEIQTVLALRDSLVQIDTVVTEEEIAEAYEREEPGLQARPRHILLRFPDDVTQAQGDSVLARTQELRRRIEAGEDFETLARRHSQDPGSAQRGGDLGWVVPGQLVQPVDEAVFALEVGQLSQPVQSSLGFHLIRVEEIARPPLDSIADQLREGIRARRSSVVEAAFVDSVMDAADVEIREDAADLVRRVAEDPRVRLSGGAGDRVLARFEGGEVTLAEVRDFMLTRDPQYRTQVVGADDRTVRRAVVDDLVRRELLLAIAAERNVAVPASEVDSLTAVARERFRSVAREIGLHPIRPREGETVSGAIERTVLDILDDMVHGRRGVQPIGAVGFVLRREYPSHLYAETALPLVVERIARARRADDAPSVDTAALPRGPDGRPYMPDDSALNR